MVVVPFGDFFNQPTKGVSSTKHTQFNMETTDGGATSNNLILQMGGMFGPC